MTGVIEPPAAGVGAEIGGVGEASTGRLTQPSSTDEFTKSRSRIATGRKLRHNPVRFTEDLMWFGKKHNPEEHRYYLLPGQGRSNRRKRRQQLIAALIAGAFFAGAIAAIMWFMNDIR